MLRPVRADPIRTSRGASPRPSSCCAGSQADPKSRATITTSSCRHSACRRRSRSSRVSEESAMDSPLKALPRYGQSVWLDYIRRSLITSGELRRLIEEDGVCGVTSNPALFEKVVTGSSDYRETLESLAERSLDAKTLYETIAIRDIQDAADELRAVYDE